MATGDDFLWPPEQFEDNDDPALADKLQRTVDIIFAQLRRLQTSAGGGAAAAHDLLSDTHTDTLVATPVDGDLIRRDASKWERLGIGIAGQALISVLGLPEWSNDGHALLIDAGNIDQGTLPSSRYLHNLLSTPHQDSTPASAVLGDIIVAQAAAAIDVDAYWLDGLPYTEIPNVLDAGDEVYWRDGLPATGLEISGEVKWQRKANSATVGYVLMAGATGPDWQPSASGGVAASVYRASDFAVTEATGTPVNLETVTLDDVGFWSSGDPSKLTVPAGYGGTYLAVGNLTMEPFVGEFWVMLRVNGTERMRRGPIANFGYSVASGSEGGASVAMMVRLNASDYVQLYAEWYFNYAGGTRIARGGAAKTFLQLLKVG